MTSAFLVKYMKACKCIGVRWECMCQKSLLSCVAVVCDQLLKHVGLCDHMDSPPGSSVSGISQARMLEWVAISSSRGSSWSRDLTQVSCVSCIAGGFFITEPLFKLMILFCIHRFMYKHIVDFLPLETEGVRN